MGREGEGGRNNDRRVTERERGRERQRERGYQQLENQNFSAQSGRSGALK